MPAWALSLAYFIHMTATVLWLGGLSILVLLALPAAQKTLSDTAYSVFMLRLQRQLDLLGWSCLFLLVGTGMFQMSASPNYEGFLEIGSRWGMAIFVKHILIGLMTGINALMTWWVMPGLARMALLKSNGQEAPELRRLESQKTRLVRLNLFISLLVLLLTSIARTA